MSDDPVGLRLATADGVSLEAEATVPAGARVAVVLAHPHPLQGGSMRSLVTSELFRILPGRGIAALRFNFRGVEGSEGTYGDGTDEAHDIIAGLDALAGLLPGRPLVIAGWSFGADVALTVLDPRAVGWFLIAPPLRIRPAEEFVAGTDARPKLLEVPEHDEFRPPDSAVEATATWINTTVEVVKGADHFLVGRTDRVATRLVDFASTFT